MIAWEFAGGEMPVFPPWELGFRTKIYRKAWSRHSDWFDSCSDSFWLVWNSHCTRLRFTVMVSYSDTLAVHSCPFLCLQRRVAKVACVLFYCWSLVRNNTVATNLQRFTLNYYSRRFVAWGQGCQIGHFMANFKKFGHFLTWPFCKLWPFFWVVTLNILSFCIFWTVFIHVTHCYSNTVVVQHFIALKCVVMI